MILKKKQLIDSRLYLILDKGACGTRPLAAVLQKALAGGVDLVQWRDKISGTSSALKEARELLEICRRHRVPFIVNDRLDIALSIFPDGIHLGQGDFPAGTARKIFGEDFMIGLSCQNTDQIKNAQIDIIDYFGFGPVFPTKTKIIKKSAGAKAYKQATLATPLPVFAIGGINAKNIHKLAGQRTRVALSREICLATDVAKTVKILKKALSQ